MKSFREVERQFVILNTPKYVVLTGTAKDANSLLCYGYVDHTAGLTYQTVAATMYVDGDYSVVDTAQLISMKIRAESVANEDIISISNKALFKQYAHIVENIDEFYYTDPEVEKCRAIKEFDQFRHADFPDDIQVMFFKEGARPEGIWVRTSKFIGCDNGTFVLDGKMLNAPHADFGVTYGDTIVRNRHSRRAIHSSLHCVTTKQINVRQRRLMALPFRTFTVRSIILCVYWYYLFKAIF